MCKRNIDRSPLATSPTGDLAMTQACAVTGNGTGDLLVLSLALHALSHTLSQGSSSFLDRMPQVEVTYNNNKMINGLDQN